MRRIICGSGADGKATVVLQGAPHRTVAANGGVHQDVWATVASEPLGTADLVAAGDLPLLPADAGGTRFRVTTFEPGAARPMHRTETVDYGVVLAGSVRLIMEDGSEVELHAGDCLVQLGGAHSWHNAGDAPAQVAFVTVAVADRADIRYV